MAKRTQTTVAEPEPAVSPTRDTSHERDECAENLTPEECVEQLRARALGALVEWRLEHPEVDPGDDEWGSATNGIAESLVATIDDSMRRQLAVREPYWSYDSGGAPWKTTVENVVKLVLEDELAVYLNDYGPAVVDARVRARQRYSELLAIGMERFQAWAVDQPPEVMDLTTQISDPLFTMACAIADELVAPLTDEQLRELLTVPAVWEFPDAGDYRGSFADLARASVGWLIREPMFESVPGYGRAPWR